MKVCVASSRPIGQKCLEWAKENLPEGVELTDMDQADIVISVMYDGLFSEEFLQQKKVCYNFHPGLLPAYRGSGAYSWVIINGESETGVTLHVIDKDIDHGPIIEKWAFPIIPEDTAGTLFFRAENLMHTMFQQWFSRLCTEQLHSIYQLPNEVGYLYLRKDLEEARDLTRYTRAFTFSGKPNAFYTTKDGQKEELRYE